MKNYSISNRVEDITLQLKEKLTENSVYIFEEPIDLHYLLGLKLSKGSLLLGEKNALFLDGRYLFSAKKELRVDVFEEEHFSSWSKHHIIEKIYFDPEKTSVQRWHQLQQLFGSKLTEMTNPLKKIRSIKSEDEIEKLKKAALINQKGISHLISCLKEGVSEKELAKEYELFCLKLGADKLSFEPIIAFGENSALPHHRASDRRLKQNEIVLIDVGVFLEGYASDATRTVCFGELDEKVRELRGRLLSFYKNLLSEIKEGSSVKELDEKARGFIEQQCHEKVLHSLGHGVGLEVHESPRISSLIKEDLLLSKNMVITIEPGVYREGLYGIRHEDTIVIKKEGIVNLYDSFYDS